MRILLLSLFGLGVLLPAAEGSLPGLASRPLMDHDFTAFESEAPVRRLALELRGAATDGGSLQMHIWLRGDTVGFGWAIDPAQPWNPQVIQTKAGGYWGLPCGLELTGGKLMGAVFRGSRQLYLIDAQVTADSVSGTWKREIYEAGKAGPTAFTGTVTDGAINGQLRARESLPGDALADGAAFVGWRNHGDGIGHSTGANMVAHPMQARVVWKSEEFVPLPYSEGNNLGAPVIKIAGGHASPIAAEGMIFQSYYVGSGTSVDYQPERVADSLKSISEGDKKGRKPPPFPEAMVRRKFSDHADQVVVAIDAATGTTVWKTVFKDDGPNLTGHGRTGLTGPDSKSPSHITPCYGDGRVYAKGTGSLIYALDAKTGETVWTSGGYRKEGRKADSMKNGPCDALCFVDGMVVTYRGGGLQALDAATGEKVWAKKARYGKGETAIRWQRGADEFLITPDGECLAPKTGDVIWQVAVGEGFNKGIAVDDRHLVYIGANGMLVFAVDGSEPKQVGHFDGFVFPRNVWPALLDGHLYGRGLPKGYTDKNGDWRTFCIDVTNGAKKGEGFGSKSYASVTGGDGLIFSCSAVSVIASRADPANFGDWHDTKSEGLPLGPADHGSPRTVFIGSPEATAIYLDGRLFCRQYDGIVCYDLRQE